MPENFQNLPLRLSLLITKFRNFHHNLMSCDSSLAIRLCHINILLELLVIRRDKTEIAAFGIGSHQDFVAMLQQIQNLTLSSSTLTCLLLNQYLNRISVHSSLQIILRNEDVIILSLHTNKTEAPACPHKSPYLHICRKRLNLSLQVNRQLSFHRQRIQHLTKILFLF